MDSFERFAPERRRGVILHAGAALVVMAVGATLFWLALQQQIGAYFILFLVLGILFLAALPWIAYRGYALMTAAYAISRDVLRLRWGLRVVEIPLADIEWLRPVDQLGFPLPLPRLAVPGAVLGTIRSPELGEVEYLASETARMVALAAENRTYVISPLDEVGFSRSLRRAMEMGSLAPVKPFSSQPAALLLKVWDDRKARTIILVGFGFLVALFVAVSLSVPTRAVVSLGFTPTGSPLEPVPSDRLLLLPVLNALVYVVDLIAGFFMYRRSDGRMLAFLFWYGAALTGVLLIAGMVLILILT